jgi:hypothetical protein
MPVTTLKVAHTFSMDQVRRENGEWVKHKPPLIDSRRHSTTGSLPATAVRSTPPTAEDQKEPASALRHQELFVDAVLEPSVA